MFDPNESSAKSMKCPIRIVFLSASLLIAGLSPNKPSVASDPDLIHFPELNDTTDIHLTMTIEGPANPRKFDYAAINLAMKELISNNRSRWRKTKFASLPKLPLLGSFHFYQQNAPDQRDSGFLFYFRENRSSPCLIYSTLKSFEEKYYLAKAFRVPTCDTIEASIELPVP